MLTPANMIAALLLIAPYLAAALFPHRFVGWVQRLPIWARLACPALLCVPYALVSGTTPQFCWSWLALYAALPVTIALLEGQGRRADREQHGNWRDFVLLAAIGLAVDLRWLESAWPPHMAIFNKVLLLDAGIYAFLGVRELKGVGFDLRLRRRDVVTGLRELALYTPLALAIGLSLGFLHLHTAWSGFGPIAGAWFFTFFFIAVPEELFFRGWLQNLLERRLPAQRFGRFPALLVTAALFGLAHFNKRTAAFNWRYVLLAALAGIFYGRAWMRDRRVGASAITHASVDAIWSLWLR